MSEFVTVTVDPKAQSILRRAGWVAAVVAFVLGLLGLLFPVAAIAVLGLVFGIYLIVAGIMRFTTAVSGSGLPTFWRVVLAVIAVLVVAAGVIALNNPFNSVVALVYVIGIGWIIDGVGYLVAAFRAGRGQGLLWALLIAGALFVIAGIVVISVPIGALASVQLLLSVVLLVVGAVSLVALITSALRARRARR